MSQTVPDLLVVMPVFNEQASIGKVVDQWFRELDSIACNFALLVIDDGSSDSTPEKLAELKDRLDGRLRTIHRENRGHGQTCMQGYRIAVEQGIPYVFQIDSDGQCDPAYFRAFWEIRHSHDVIYGKRTREDGFHRQLASLILRSFLLVLFRTWCVDANVPYRLMRTERCAPVFERIPKDLFLANVGLSVLLRREPGIREASVPIRFMERIGGEPSVPLSRFAAKAIELFRQLRTIAR